MCAFAGSYKDQAAMVTDKLNELRKAAGQILSSSALSKFLMVCLRLGISGRRLPLHNDMCYLVFTRWCSFWRQLSPHNISCLRFGVFSGR